MLTQQDDLSRQRSMAMGTGQAGDCPHSQTALWAGCHRTLLLPGLPGAPHPDTHCLLPGEDATPEPGCLHVPQSTGKGPSYLVGLYSWFHLGVTVTMRPSLGSHSSRMTQAKARSLGN